MTLFKFIFLFFLIILSFGCQQQSIKPDKSVTVNKVYQQAVEVEDKEKPKEIVEVPYPVAVPQALPIPEPLSDKKDREVRLKENRQAKPAIAIDEANLLAKQFPVKDGYFNSIMQYDYMVGALYQLYAAPKRLTDIMLQPGEKLIDKAAGDTTRWIVGETVSGSGPNEQTHILVKPVRDGLKTSLVITTDMRTYHLQLTSFKNTYMTALSWRYPHDDLRKRQIALKQRKQTYQKVIDNGFTDLSNLDFGYDITGDEPVWKPVRVFDNGEKTYIQLPSKSKYFERPVLFVVSQSNEMQLVNYRVKGDYYIVDRLFDSAELVVGDKTQVKVSIERINKRDVQKAEASSWNFGD